jgi:DNA-binding NarL/FixJ family response regulator
VGELEELVVAIKEVASGGSAIDPKVVGALVQGRARASGGELSRLTPRELEVLGAMAEGQTNSAIASSLFISQRAVEKHISSVFAKLGLSGDQVSHPRVRAMLMYLAEGKT